MKKWQKILVAIVACGIIWAIYLAITVNAGFEHGGGAIPMMIVIGIIIFVWRSVVGNKSEAETDNENKEADSSETTLQDSVDMENREKAGLETREIELTQDGIMVTMSLPVQVIDEMERLKNQDSEKWSNNSFELVREAKRRIRGISNYSENESRVETTVHDETSTEANVEQTSVGVKSYDEMQPEKETPFDGKLESEYRREAKAEAHWIVQDGTEMCINIEELVYRKMVELQTENPKRWVNKEWDLYQKAKSILQKRSHK